MEWIILQKNTRIQNKILLKRVPELKKQKFPLFQIQGKGNKILLRKKHFQVMGGYLIVTKLRK